MRGVFVSREGVWHKRTPNRERGSVNARMCPPRASAVAADVLSSPELLRSFESCILELSSAGNRGWAPSHVPRFWTTQGQRQRGPLLASCIAASSRPRTGEHRCIQVTTGMRLHLREAVGVLRRWPGRL